ncbi:MAG: CHAT domain-containing protein [Bryobacterales bacterium]|nr:CHAT domain-containing protein [Bryobacterales bacterium]
MFNTVAVAWAMLTAGALAQTWDGAAIEKQIGPAEVHTYRLRAAAGQFLHISAAQLQGDSSLKLLLPDGRTFTEIDRLPYEGIEDIPLLAPATGEYTIEVRVADLSAPARYRLEGISRAATDQDRSRVAAFAASWIEARRLREQQATAAYKEAITRYEAALPEWRKAGSLQWEVFTLSELGWVHDRLGDHRKAKEVLEQALALRPVPEERFTRAAMLNGLAEMHTSLGANRRAIELYQESLAIRRAAGDRRGEATVLTGIGGAYMNLSEFARAIEVMTQALPLRRETKDVRGEAVTHSNLAGSYYAAGNLQEALTHYSEARRLSGVAGDKRNEAIGAMGIGRTYYGLGDYRRALEILKTAEAELRKLGDRAALGTAVYLIGGAQIFLAGHDAALPYLEESLALYRQTGRSGSQAIALVALCRSQLATSQWDRAMATALEGAKLARAAGSKANLGSCLACQGRVELAKGNHERALPLLNEALELFRQSGGRDDQAITLIGLAHVERARGNLGVGIGHMEEATKLLESMRQQMTRPELRASYRAARADRLDLYTAMLMEMHEREPEVGYSERAFNLTEQWRARSLAEMLSAGRDELREEMTAEQRQEEERLLVQVSNLQRDLLRGTPGAVQQKELQAKLSAAEQEFDTFQTMLKRSGSRYAAGQYVDTLNAKRIASELLDGETVLIEYALGEQRSYGWAVTQEGLTHAVLPARALLERQTEAYRKLLAQPVTALTAARAMTGLDTAGKGLYDGLVAPFEKVLAGKKRVVIVPDGLLSYLPFEALPGARRMVERFSISYVPSASALAALRQRQKSRQTPARALLAFADPTPALEAARERGLALTSLPNARVEVAGIRALFPRAASTVFMGAEAGEQALKAADTEAFRYLHLAAHGYFDEQHPARSGIVLAAGGAAGQDGVLQAREVMSLRLNADLVTLSACESGLGRLLDGEGVMGLTRAFLYAGAQSTVVSLWKVNDAATAELMKRFYGHIKAGLSRDEALRQAKLGLMAMGSAWRHPYYWAPLVFTGERGP